jgi:hypothetical protein
MSWDNRVTVKKEPSRISTPILPLTFYLQTSIKSEWTRGDSDPYPTPCEGGKIVCQRFLERAKHLQIEVFGLLCFSQSFRMFTRVAAQLLHNR